LIIMHQVNFLSLLDKLFNSLESPETKKEHLRVISQPAQAQLKKITGLKNPQGIILRNGFFARTVNKILVL